MTPSFFVKTLAIVLWFCLGGNCFGQIPINLIINKIDSSLSNLNSGQYHIYCREKHFTSTDTIDIIGRVYFNRDLKNLMNQKPEYIINSDSRDHMVVFDGT